ncbi:hypothetical protein HYE82_31985, partial [Streptomyces sp. BR123]|uniref:hypothetical protein n=1 Tax=Streptomyces sp. BR123 TaxID=2749828 RepID=UPI0015C4E03B
MPTDTRQPAVRTLVLLCTLFFFLSASASLSIAMTADDPRHSAVGPPSPIPADWDGQWSIGLDTEGHYCLVEQIRDPAACHLPGTDDPPIPGRTNVCEGADGNGARNCDEQGQREAEVRQLRHWREGFSDKDQKKYKELIVFVSDCVAKDGRPFSVCKKEGTGKFGDPVQTPLEWAAGKFSQFASSALQEAASYIGKSVVWLLEKFAQVFTSNSSINLKATGLGKFTALMTALSAVVACFLLLLQFGKVAVSHNGAPVATALTGLAKWAVISSVYLLVAQEALRWSDVVSDWIVTYTFSSGKGSGSASAAEAMQDQLGTLFGGLITGGGGAATATGALITGEGVAASAVGVIIVIGILCILAIAALWVEILLRQVGIMLIIGTMPITLAGQLSDATTAWWPKARNAFVSLVLMKPAIVCCFSIGFLAMSEGEGMQNVIFGFVMFLASALCWPALAKFMVFTTNGAGTSMASGWISSLGSSASSRAGSLAEPSGAGSVGGGAGYTKALDSENDATAQAASSAPAAGGRAGSAARSAPRFGGRAVSVATLGLQALAAGKDTLESGLANTAAHAGLDQGSAGGRHVVVPPRRQPTPA